MKIEPLRVKDKTIEFAQAQPADADELLRVIHTAYAEFLGKLDPPSGAFGETSASIQEKMAKGGAIKATSEGTIVGCVLYERRADYMYFGRLAVLPAWRRYGIAKGLIRAVEICSRAANLDQVQIGVRLVCPRIRRIMRRWATVPSNIRAIPVLPNPLRSRWKSS